MICWRTLVCLFSLAPIGGGNQSSPPPTIPLEKLVTMSGQTVDLKRDQGVTLLVFVARWCPPCESALAQVRRYMAEHRQNGFQAVVIGVQHRQTAPQFQAWLRGAGYHGLAVFDETGRVQQTLKTEELPWHVVVGPGGQVLHAAVGAPQEEDLARWLGS